MLSRLSLIAGFLVSLSAQSREAGKIRVLVVDAFGHPLQGAVVSCKNSDGREVSLSAPLPFGTYNIHVEEQPYVPFERTVRLFTRSKVVVAGLAHWDIANISGSSVNLGFSIHLRVRKVRDGDHLVALARSIYSDYTDASEVPIDGRVDFDTLPNGLYSILVMKQDKVLVEGRVSVDDPSSEESLTLSLPRAAN